MTTGTFALKIGADLHLSCETSREGFAIWARDNERNQLDLLATSAAPPSDAIIGAARATAIALFPNHVTLTADQREKLTELSPFVEIKPHRYQRNRPGWDCKVCPFDGHHEIHQNIPPATRQ